MPDFIKNISYQSTVTIANGATLSDAVDLSGYVLVGLIIPAAFTGTTITFSMSDDNATFYGINNAGGTALSATVAVSKCILFTPGDFVGIRHLKLTSGSAEAAARTIKLITRELT